MKNFEQKVIEIFSSPLFSFKSKFFFCILTSKTSRGERKACHARNNYLNTSLLEYLLFYVKRPTSLHAHNIKQELYIKTVSQHDELVFII